MSYEETTSQHYFDLLDGAEHWAINQVIDKVIELEIKNAKLKDTINRLARPFFPEEGATIQDENTRLRAENAKLREEIAELRLDKERVDCLERLGEKGTDVFIDRDHPMYAIRIWPKIGPGPQYDGDSLRAAIDSWRKAENEKSQKSS